MIFLDPLLSLQIRDSFAMENTRRSKLQATKKLKIYQKIECHRQETSQGGKTALIFNAALSDSDNCKCRFSAHRLSKIS